MDGRRVGAPAQPALWRGEDVDLILVDGWHGPYLFYAFSTPCTSSRSVMTLITTAIRTVL